MRNLTASQRRQALEKELKIKLENISQFTLDAQKIANRNCENMIGAIQVPLGIAGPMKLTTHSSASSSLSLGVEDLSSLPKGNSQPTTQEYYLPLATTEGALVASVNRGCKATLLSGGITTFVENIGATRAPVFKIKNLHHGQQVVKWVKQNFAKLKQVASKTDSFLQLTALQPFLVGRHLYLRLIFNTAEAMGMNMVTRASGELTKLIAKETQAQCVAVTGNLCADKKPSWSNVILGRGKKVWAEAVIKKAVVKKILKTTSQKMAEVVSRKCHLGSIIAGSLGFNAHFANILSALFIATGQDPAHVTEGSLGITTAEVLTNGHLYFSVYLPDLMVGTIGGGTHLATQKEALSILGLGKGEKGESKKFAKIIAAAVLCGELSLIAALSAGHLVKAHEELGRGKTKCNSEL